MDASDNIDKKISRLWIVVWQMNKSTGTISNLN